MRIDIHAERCIGSGVCALIAPELFDQRDDDGVVVLLDPDPAPEQQENAYEAATRCPASVIEIHEEG
ncbi:ferredoxin [Rugosimonospora africana]|uniref:Ferredoxin n=1 Tax=Rugosimonospora africana TaxID=556532 RepID=A0A8J3QSU4_9ACTN|nr:ferredoxin [Rugosimonospora africana]GIH16830.1 ferredoxin [Rugosimonospora africana]